jgi:hypothetical protein
MEKKTLQIAIQIPEDFIEAIEQYIAQHQQECLIERKVIPPATSKGEELAFDPATLTPIVWVGLKFVGDAALNIALGMLSSAIYDRWKKRDKDNLRGDINLRFPNGEFMTIDPEQPLDVKLLEEKLGRSKKP